MFDGVKLQEEELKRATFMSKYNHGPMQTQPDGSTAMIILPPAGCIYNRSSVQKETQPRLLTLLHNSEVK